MEKIDEVTQIMSILIVLSIEIMHLTFVSFFLISFRLVQMIWTLNNHSLLMIRKERRWLKMTISKSLVTMMMMKRMKMMETCLIQFVQSVIMEGSSYGKHFLF
jgi:hypothetical protein